MNLTKQKVIELGKTARKHDKYTDDELVENVRLLDLLISYFIARGDSGIIIQGLVSDQHSYTSMIWARGIEYRIRAAAITLNSGGEPSGD